MQLHIRGQSCDLVLDVEQNETVAEIKEKIGASINEVGGAFDLFEEYHTTALGASTKMRDITASNVWLIHEDQSCMVLSSAQFEKIKSLSPSTPLPELNRTSNEETLNQFNSMNDGVLNVVTTLDSNKKRYCVDDDTIGLDINGKRYYMLNSRFLRLLKAIECKLEWVPFTREYGTVGYYVNGDITLTEMEKGFVAVAYPIKFDGNIIKNTMFLGSELFGYHKNRNKYACKEGAYDGADDDGFDSEDDDKDLMEAGADSKEDDNNDDPCDESNEKAAKCRATMTLIVLPSGERWLRRTYHDAGQIHLPSHDTHSIAPIEAYKTYSASEFKQMVLDTRTEKKKKLEIPGEMVQRKNHKGVYNSYAIPSPARDETKKTHAFVANILWRTRGHVNRKSLSPKIAKEIGGNVNTASVMYNGVEYIKSTSWLCQKVHGAGKAACRTFAKVEINKDNNKLCTIVLSTDFAKATQKQASKKSTNKPAAEKTTQLGSKTSGGMKQSTLKFSVKSKKERDSESSDEDDFENSFKALPPKHEVISRRAAATKKVNFIEDDDSGDSDNGDDGQATSSDDDESWSDDSDEDEGDDNDDDSDSDFEL